MDMPRRVAGCALFYRRVHDSTQLAPLQSRIRRRWRMEDGGTDGTKNNAGIGIKKALSDLRSSLNLLWKSELGETFGSS